MIEGFRVRIPSDELSGLLAKRATYHQNRADVKEKELPALEESLQRTKPDRPVDVGGKVSNYASSRNPQEDVIDELERAIVEHRNKAVSFKFLSEHLFDEDYNLSEADLFRLELVARY